MSRSLGKKIFKGILWFIAGLIILVSTVPALLYVPFVQSWVKDIALKEVNKSTGMDISVDYLRLRFPLKLQLDGVRVIEASGDTMVTAAAVGLNVRLLPLLKGDIQVGRADIDSVRYQLGNADSLMWLRAAVCHAEVDASSMNFSSGNINVDRALVEGADVSLRMLPDTVETPSDTTASRPLRITARDITLRDVTYRMSMLPTIDSLGAHIVEARLQDGLVDMASKRINARSLNVDSVTAAYLTPSAEYLSQHPERSVTDTASLTPDSLMWTITADRIGLTGRRALYAMRGVRPLPGLDMSYLQADDIVIDVDSFYNRGASIRVPLRRLSATERCGVHLDASGVFEMDSSRMVAKGFDISTMYSSLRLDASMGMGDLSADPDLPLVLKADARISQADVKMVMPALSPMMRGLPASDLTIVADIEGTPRQLNVYDVRASMPGLLRLKAAGQVENVMNPARLGGQLALDGSLTGLNAVKPTFLEAKLARQVNIPPIKLSGEVEYHPMSVDGNLRATTLGGELVMDATWNGRTEGYDVSVDLDRFPVGKIMPSLGVGYVTASLDAKGRGYNPMSPSTDLDVALDVLHVDYSGQDYTDVELQAHASGGHAEGFIRSGNRDADLHAAFTAEITRESCSWELDGDVRNLNLQALKLTPETNGGSLLLTSAGTYWLHTGDIDAKADIDDLEWHLPGMNLATPNIKASVLSNDSTLEASVVNGDMTLDLKGRCRLDTFMNRVMRASDIAMRQVNERQIDVTAISGALPYLKLDARVGRDNIVKDYLSLSGIGFNSASLSATNDSVFNARADVYGFENGSMRLDSISVDLEQRGKYLIYLATVNNRPGTMDDFAHVSLNGYVAYDRLSAILRQSNIKGERGFGLGLRANATDSVVTMKLVPYHPTIAYKEWTVNSDNFISYNLLTRHIDANLMLSNDKSYLKIFTEHVEGAENEEGHQEDIVLQVSRIKLQDWLSISPFAPPIKGDVSADMRFRWDAHDITGKGSLSLSDLYYGRDRVGTFDIALDLRNSSNGAINAEATLMVDSIKTITAVGTLNDSTKTHPFLLDFSMIHFPLRVVNPFLPPGVAKLSGMLNGQMDITGSLSAPVFNGYLDFDSTAVKVNMLGTSFKFSEEKIPVDSNVVKFNGFTVLGANKNPLSINGTVDARSLSDIGIDLNLKARNMMIVNSSRPRGADVYGKGYIDLDADVDGNMSMMKVDASLALLSGSNVTYVLSGGTSTLTSYSSGDMVRFVQFNDTAQVVKADSISTSSMALYLDADVDIQEGTTINVDLSPDGKNRVQIQGNGQLEYTMNPMNDGRLTGRFNLPKGFVRYTPPFMSEKLFNFQEGSYVAFNGDMLNPILNVHAVDRIKANVTQEGQNSRLIYFDVSLAVTNTLQNMNVAFDLSTDDDITVQNELQSMSAEQRANQAMNLLLYNTYTGAGTKGNANLGGNALYSFLESQLNSWVANNIRGVDISFGIDQYDKTLNGNTSTATSYSYRVSKTLFNDRFKIIVGGNYSTDADADENFSQNLINDISFEYMLNRSGSMYVKIFRHTGYESILEGEVTQTGVGFVLKRKIHSLRDLFRFGKGNKDQTPVLPLPVPDATVPQPVSTSTDDETSSK